MNALMDLKVETTKSINMMDHYFNFQSQLDTVLSSEIEFDNGIAAFSDLKNFTFEKDEKIRPFLYMKSKENSKVSFVCVDPYILHSSYDVKIKESHLSDLKGFKAKDYIVLCFVTLGQDLYNTTANLMSPVLINTKTLKGQQIILDEIQTEFIRFNVWNSVSKAV